MTITFYHLTNNLDKDDFEIIKKRFLRTAKEIAHSPHFENLSALDVVVDAGKLNNPLIVSIAKNQNRLDITVDPTQPIYRDPSVKMLERSIVHELHHIARLRTAGMDYSLACRLISEGMAVAFEKECGHKPAAYAQNLCPNEMRRAEDKARTIITAGKRIDTNHWFFGNETLNGIPAEQRIKQWTGYSLGASLIASWLDWHNAKEKTKLTAAKAVTIPHQDIITPWLDDRFNASDSCALRRCGSELKAALG